MLDAAQSAQGLNSSAHTLNSSPKPIIVHKGLGSHKECLGRAQEAVEIVCKWSGTNYPWDRGWSAFYRNIEKLAVGAVRANRSTITVRPVQRLQTGSRHSLKKSLSDDTIGLGPGHVRRWARQVWWSRHAQEKVQPVWPVREILAHFRIFVSFHHSWNLSGFWAPWFFQDHHAASLFIVRQPILKR
jgi:hypothetical protein